MKDKQIKHLNASLSTPARSNAYSLGVEYMKKWFIKEFPKNFFKKIHINEENVLSEVKEKFDINAQLKAMKPSLSITPQTQFEFDNDKINLYQSPSTLYSRRSIEEGSFFRDFKKNLFLGVALDQIRIGFSFRVRLASRDQQLNAYEFMKLHYRVGSTQTHDVDMDFHIPYELMLQLAKDAGFEIKNNKIVNIFDFLKYVNSKSCIPVIYKFRTSNGRSEFFIHFQDISLHINNTTEMSADDGEREQMLFTNYTIEMTPLLTLPAPKMYMYYSIEEHDMITDSLSQGDEQTLGLYSIQLAQIPEENEKNWRLHLLTDCIMTDEELKEGKATIDLRNSSLLGSDLETIIDNHTSMLLSPTIFVDFKLFNDSREIEYEIDWEKIELKIDTKLTNMYINIAMYIDLEYVNDQIKMSHNLTSNNKRIENSNE